MADNDPVVFGMNDAARIDRAVNAFEQNVIGRNAPRKRQVFPADGPGIVSGRLVTAMSAASNRLTGATTFQFAKYVPDPAGDAEADPQDLMEEVDENGDPVYTTGVNRSTIFNASVDGYVICGRSNREWIPLYAEDPCPE